MESAEGGPWLRSQDPDVVPIRVRNAQGNVICTVYVGPEAAIAEPTWVHPHRIDARNSGRLPSQLNTMSFVDAFWGNQPSRIQAARRLRALSQQIWTIGDGAAVYCTEGRHRSPSAVGAFLIDYHHMTPAAVLELFQEAFATRDREAPEWARLLSILTGYKQARDAGDV